MLDQLSDDEEVGRVALHVNDVDLVIGALVVLLRNSPTFEAVLQTTVDFLAQPRRRGLPLRYRCQRHAVMWVFFPQLAVITNALRDPQRVIATIRDHVVPDLTHLLRRLDVVTSAIELEAIWVQQCLTGLHTQHRLVRWRLGFQDVVAVIGH